MVEYLLKDLEEKIEEENKRNRKQEADYKKQSSDYKMPKVGDTNYGGFKTPKLSVPSMNMPRI